jgi:DNA-binding CsgD family transcriptional regulator
VLPYVKLKAVGDGIDAAFGRAVPLARAVKPFAPVEGLLACHQVADVAHLVDLEAQEPLAWRYPAAVGVDRLNGASRADTFCVGDHVDQLFARSVLVPSYYDAIAAAQPIVHRIAAVSNDTFLSYQRLTVPLFARATRERPSHLVILTLLELAIPNARLCADRLTALTSRERQCLSLAAGGLGQQQIADAMNVSEKMVELHLAHIRRKLGVRTTSQAISTALASAWIEQMTG